MFEFVDVHQKFSATKTIDELWSVYKNVLDEYGFTSVMYCVSHAGVTMTEDGVESTWYKCDHPDEYRVYFDEEFHIEDDPSALHCITEVDPYLWNDRVRFEQQNEKQKRFMRESGEFGMQMGVTLPLRFGVTGVGGMGLNAGNLCEPEFNKVWQHYGDDIITIARLFDEFARSEKVKGMYSLSAREQQVLTLLIIGKKTIEIADKIGSTVSTVEKQIRSARRKLNARNNEQAVARALAFNLITP